ncbi:MAG: hypothetical protein E7309_16080 [Butyrivibrio sp.]|jgi:hypothetical protein|nr:hypothetical protein [Butyrivibrio sp.]
MRNKRRIRMYLIVRKLQSVHPLLFVNRLFYTTNIMTTNLTGVIIRYIREISGADKISRKGKERDMTTMNRNYCLYSESYESSLQSKSEWMFNFMRSFKDRQMRDNVVLAKSLIV